MQKAFLKILMVFVIMAVFGAIQTVSAADKLPLERGIYVAEGVSCKDADRKQCLSYDGQAFYEPYSRGCIKSTITKIQNKGNVYQLTEKYENIGSDLKPNPSTGRRIISVKNKTSFSIIPADDQKEFGRITEPIFFHYCGKGIQK